LAESNLYELERLRNCGAQEERVMGRRIDQFCEDVRLKLLNIDSGLSGLKSKLNSKAELAGQTVRKHLDEVRKRMQLGRAKVAGAHAEMKNWTEEQRQDR